MTKIIAEIGINHNGDLDITRKLIDVAVAAGCDYVKFQKRDLDMVFGPQQLAKPKESPWGTTYGEYKRRLEFARKEFDEIDKYCKGKIKC